jgi:hypothetical protein
MCFVFWINRKLFIASRREDILYSSSNFLAINGMFIEINKTPKMQLIELITFPSKETGTRSPYPTAVIDMKINLKYYTNAEYFIS